MMDTKTRTVTSPGMAQPGPTLEPGPGGSGRALPEGVTWGHLPVGSPPAGGTVRGRCLEDRGGSRRRGPRQPDPWTRKLALGTWNVTSLAGKEPEIVREVERFRLEIVGITSCDGSAISFSKNHINKKNKSIATNRGSE